MKNLFSKKFYLIAAIMLLGSLIFFSGAAYAAKAKAPAAPATPVAPAAPAAPAAPINDTPGAKAIDAISTIRSYIEFYFMESGIYPESLSDLERDLNSLVPKDLAGIKIPVDPATGKPFVYALSNDKKSYSLKFPDPIKYGLPNTDLGGVTWGGFTQLAEERRVKTLQMICYENIKGIATAVEYYIKDNKNKLPAQLKDLIPRYIRTMPVCPVSGKPYEYKVEGENYIVSCPNPAEHGGMKDFTFHSGKGWITK